MAEKTFLWHDNWHPFGPLSLCCNNDSMTSSGIGKDALVSSIVVDSHWAFPHLNHLDLVEVRILLHNISPNSLVEDSICWVPSSSGVYSAASAREILSGDHPKVPWSHLLWFSQNIPRMSFVLWLAIKGKLSTLDRISSYNPRVTITCALCLGSPESIEHLFFGCPYSAYIWNNIIDKCELIGCPQSWSVLIPWAASSWHGKSVSSSVNRLCLAASVYYIWRERNCRIFKSLTCPPNVTLKAILNTVRSKICSFGLKISAANNFIASTWNIPLS